MPTAAAAPRLYAVIGPARQLDRNITVVGRVVAGMPLLASLQRGPAPMGFYDKQDMNVPIASVKLAADVPEDQRSHIEVMRTERPIYQAVVDAAAQPRRTVEQVLAGVCGLVQRADSGAGAVSRSSRRRPGPRG